MISKKIIAKCRKLRRNSQMKTKFPGTSTDNYIGDLKHSR